MPPYELTLAKKTYFVKHTPEHRHGPVKYFNSHLTMNWAKDVIAPVQPEAGKIDEEVQKTTKNVNNRGKKSSQINRQRVLLEVLTEDGRPIAMAQACHAQELQALTPCKHKTKEFDQFYHIHRGNYFVITNLSLTKETVQAPLVRLLCSALFDSVYQLNGAMLFCNVPECLLSVFYRLGFRAYRGFVPHPLYNHLTPMALDCFDLEFLKNAGSVLYPIAVRLRQLKAKH